MNKLSEENRRLVERTFPDDGPFGTEHGWRLSAGDLNRLLNAARSEALSSPGGQGNTEAQGCGTDGAVSFAAANHEAQPSAAGAVSAVDAATGTPVPGPWTRSVVEGLPLHHRTAALVNRFTVAVAEKLARAEQKYGYSDGWSEPDWQDECRRQLHHHAAKGDPRDVAAYAAFCWHHGWSTSPPAESGASGTDGQGPLHIHQPSAEGAVSQEDDRAWCETCDGTGKIVEAARYTGANAHSACQMDCEDCDGEGRR